MNIEQNIIRIISDKIGVDITKKNRSRDYVLGRAMYYDIAYSKLNLGSLEHVGSLVGLDHASVIHSMRKVFPHIKIYYKPYYIKYLSVLNTIGIHHDDNKILSIDDRYNDLIIKYNNLSKDYDQVLSMVEFDKSNSELNELVQSIIKLPHDKVSKLKVRVDAIIHML